MNFFQTHKKTIITAVITLLISGGTFTTIITYASLPNKIENNCVDIEKIKVKLTKKVNVETYKENNKEISEALKLKANSDFVALVINSFNEKLDILIKVQNNAPLTPQQHVTVNKIVNK